MNFESYEKPIAQNLCEHWKKDSTHFTAGCETKTNPSENYIHKSLPYKSSYEKRPTLSASADQFDQVSPKSAQYMGLGASQQCEHLN